MNPGLKLELNQIIAQVKQKQMQGTSPDNG
jgi:hypothetical protein